MSYSLLFVSVFFCFRRESSSSIILRVFVEIRYLLWLFRIGERAFSFIVNCCPYFSVSFGILFLFSSSWLRDLVNDLCAVVLTSEFRSSLLLIIILIRQVHTRDL